MKINSISAQNSVSSNKNQNKQAFGMKLEVSPKLLGQITTKQDKFMMGVIQERALSNPSNARLGIYTADNQIVGELTNGSKKPIASKIANGNCVAPDNYFKIPKIIEGIYNNAITILNRQK